jgi:hypothetical protein
MRSSQKAGARNESVGDGPVAEGVKLWKKGGWLGLLIPLLPPTPSASPFCSKKDLKRFTCSPSRYRNMLKFLFSLSAREESYLRFSCIGSSFLSLFLLLDPLQCRSLDCITSASIISGMRLVTKIPKIPGKTRSQPWRQSARLRKRKGIGPSSSWGFMV